MRLSLHTLFGILCAMQTLVLVRAPAPAPPPTPDPRLSRVLVLKADPDTKELEPKIFDGEPQATECKDPSSAITAFTTKHMLCTNSPVWGTYFSKHSDLLLKDNDLLRWRLMMWHFGRTHKRGEWDQNALEKSLPKLKEGALKNIPGEFVQFIVPFLQSSQIEKLDDSVYKKGIENMRERHLSYVKLFIDKMKSSVRKDHGGLILQELGNMEKKNQDVILELSENALRDIISNPDSCAKFTTSLLMKLGSNKAKASLITAACAENIPLDDKDCDKNLGNFEHFFNRFEKTVPPSCIKYMSPVQAETFGSEMEKSKCSAFNMSEDMTPEAAAKISATCFAERASQDTVKMGKLWESMAENVLGSFGADSSDITKIDEDDYKYISAKQKQHYIDDPKHCNRLPVGFFKYHPGMSVSKECFEGLEGESQAYALVGSNLPNDATANIGTEVDHWEFNTGSEELKGLMVFEAASRKSNIRPLIENLSRDVTGPHACSTLNVDKLVRNPVVQRYANDACLGSAKDIRGDDWKKLDERLQSMRPFEELKDSMKEDDWKKITEAALAAMANNETMCKQLDAATFHIIKRESLKALGGKCVSELPFLQEITPEEIKLLSSGAFRLFTASLAAKINLEHLTDEQFEQLGADVTDAAQHPASAFTQATIEALPINRIKKMSAKAWAAVPPGSYQGINAERLAAIPATSMSDMKLEQLQKIPVDVLAKISVEQISLVGANYKDDKTPEGKKKGPLAAFTKEVLAKMPAETKLVLKQRSDAAMVVPTVLSAVLALAAIATLSVV